MPVHGRKSTRIFTPKVALIDGIAQLDYEIEGLSTGTASVVKILLIRLDHMGDLVLTTPLIRALAKAGNQVDVVVPRWLGPLLEDSPYIKERFAIEDVAPNFPAGWQVLARWIKPRGYDCILLPNARPAQLLWASWASGVRRRVAAHARWWGRLTFHQCLRVREAFQQGRHFSDIQLDLARALEIPTDGLKADYFFREGEIATAQAKIKSMFPDYAGEPIMGVHPGCAGNTCNLPSPVYGDIAGMILARTKARVIVTGSQAERALLASWPDATLTSPRLHVAMGDFDLRGLAALISQFDNYVIVGTGPLHLASAVGIRTASPFCAVPPLSFANWGNMNGRGTCVHPEPARCRKWLATGNPYGDCSFRGEINAESFWPLLKDTESPSA